MRLSLWVCGRAAQQKQCAINALYEAPFAKRQKPIHLNRACVNACVHACAHSHTPPLQFPTFDIQCVILHIDAHLHTHRCVRERSHRPTLAYTCTQTVSIPLLFFVLLVVYYRSQLCNCVGVAYFLNIALSLSFSLSDFHFLHLLSALNLLKQQL